MLFFTGKDDMGLEASLRLLDLPPDATIDDANQAYAYLHRKIDLFHQDTGTGERGDQQEDIELLTCAYEKAIAYLSDQHPRKTPSATTPSVRSSGVDMPESTDLHFTINLKAEATERTSPDDLSSKSDADARTIEEALSITTRQMQQAESVLPEVQQAVAEATAAVAEANRRYESAKQASIIAVVAAKSAKSRSLLLEVEANRAMAEAIAAAEKARDRVVAARKEASDARTQAGRARERASRVKKSEDSTAAEVICAEGFLEKEKARLKVLTHSLLANRNRMALFQKAGAGFEAQDSGVFTHGSAAVTDYRFSSSRAVDGDTAARQQILSDLLDIEASLTARKRGSIREDEGAEIRSDAQEASAERRQHSRLVYPLDQCPQFSMQGRSLTILDLSTTGMCLEAVTDMTRQRIIRGAIAFAGNRPVNITGKVVRTDERGLGLKLVTRISKHILDQERLRLSN